jgi:hypothetical protein
MKSKFLVNNFLENLLMKNAKFLGLFETLDEPKLGSLGNFCLLSQNSELKFLNS